MTARPLQTDVMPYRDFLAACAVFDLPAVLPVSDTTTTGIAGVPWSPGSSVPTMPHRAAAGHSRAPTAGCLGTADTESDRSTTPIGEDSGRSPAPAPLQGFFPHPQHLQPRERDRISYPFID
jgi:hypothetical protein